MDDRQDRSDDRSDSFASLFEQSPVKKGRALRVGERIEGTVILVGRDAVFVEVDGKREAFIEAAELRAPDGTLSIKVGDTTFKFYFTPGHTVGATSIEFQVRDRGKSYRAIVPGGMGMQFGPEWTPVFIKSVERLKQLGPWDVMLGNHPFLMPRDLELEIEPELAKRGDGPNPAIVGAASINQWFDAVLKVANEKLVSEQGQKP